MPALASLAPFTQAVAEFPVSDPGLVLEPAARAAAGRSAAESGLVLLGEMHGVRENPLLIRLPSATEAVVPQRPWRPGQPLTTTGV
jgi:hypothetical protein